MPVLTARAPKSVTTASIWLATTSAGTACTAATPRLFCAVTAVTALRPYTWCAANVLRSACTPAPPPESLPAMVSAVVMIAA